ncbi:hypothetical protein LWC33_32995 [Pseudonocardia sp. RS11V-5]|uniref:hypothetical protein n=1 Tax=Pseudonocardia terrae TaxID=2905831 RepID=UPI001E3F1766|nr:hypothetical protein [Pseudonocardia terrae]MCE3556246.1 hypothetical protein [Pseudonocardia terrae]
MALLIVIAVVVTIVKWLLITAAILAVPFGAWFVYDRVSVAKRRAKRRAKEERAVTSAVERRREVESRAVFDAAGGCGWCGQRSMHLDALGGVMHPAAFHRHEIEETIAATPPR